MIVVIAALVMWCSSKG